MYLGAEANGAIYLANTDPLLLFPVAIDFSNAEKIDVAQLDYSPITTLRCETTPSRAVTATSLDKSEIQLTVYRWRNRVMIIPRKLVSPDAEMDALRHKLGTYAIRYHLSGPMKERLVDQTFIELANEPDILLDKPIEQAIAETMHRVFMTGKAAQ